MQAPTASIIIIGNEILSGRTQDKNIGWLAKALNEAGIRLIEARVIPDSEPVIIETVNACRKASTYIFTTGGIGPTHDDITAAAIAKAFGVPIERNNEAEVILRRHYGDSLNAARLRMAEMPVGAGLIKNPVSAAPGFIMENVFVMAGVPAIMQAMFESIRHRLQGGPKMLTRTVSAYVTEGIIAETLTAIQHRHPNVEIGSYPFIRQQRLGVSLVVRTTDVDALNAVYGELKAMLLAVTQEVVEEDLAAG